MACPLIISDPTGATRTLLTTNTLGTRARSKHTCRQKLTSDQVPEPREEAFNFIVAQRTIGSISEM